MSRGERIRSILSALRFLALPALQAATLSSFLLGGEMLWAGCLIYATVAIVLDPVVPTTERTHAPQTPLYFEGVIWLSATLVFVQSAVLAFYAADTDVLWLGRAFAALGGDLFAARADTTWLGYTGGILSVGLIFSAMVGCVGHELVHMRGRAVALMVGRWLYACGLYPNYIAHHVHFHHRLVGTKADYATVRRGVGFWRYLPSALLRSQGDLYELDAARLAGQRGLAPIVGNRAVRGLMMCTAVLGAYYLAAGWPGVGIAVAMSVVFIFNLELATYIGHYGLVRVPSQPVEARHSWCSFKGLSTGMFFNLQRHAHHHLDASQPYWRLEKLADAPMYPLGSPAMGFCALIPPLWFRLIGPALAAWDTELASPQELELISKQLDDVPTLNSPT